eukprot:scaffold461_cov321-Pavlova_lutheri.AAC.17
MRQCAPGQGLNEQGCFTTASGWLYGKVPSQPLDGYECRSFRQWWSATFPNAPVLHVARSPCLQGRVSETAPLPVRHVASSPGIWRRALPFHRFETRPLLFDKRPLPKAPLRPSQTFSPPNADPSQRTSSLGERGVGSGLSNPRSRTNPGTSPTVRPSPGFNGSGSKGRGEKVDEGVDMRSEGQAQPCIAAATSAHHRLKNVSPWPWRCVGCAWCGW